MYCFFTQQHLLLYNYWQIITLIKYTWKLLQLTSVREVPSFLRAGQSCPPNTFCGMSAGEVKTKLSASSWVWKVCQFPRSSHIAITWSVWLLSFQKSRLHVNYSRYNSAALTHARSYNSQIPPKNAATWVRNLDLEHWSSDWLTC